jgi:hypothetical protein
MGTMERLAEIDERMEQLRKMGDNCCKLIGMYNRMNHPNRDELVSVYENNLKSLKREYKELKVERESLMLWK